MIGLLLIGYLAAIVAANLTTTHYAAIGHPEVSVYTAFVLVAFDAVARDRLHDAWHGARRVVGLAGLIAAGSVLSYVANPDSSKIAVASAVAFGAAMLADTLLYQAVHRLDWLRRSNISNIAAGLVDSLVFVAMAFGSPFLTAVAFGQFTAKVAGGFVWSLLLERRRPAET